MEKENLKEKKMRKNKIESLICNSDTYVPLE